MRAACAALALLILTGCSQNAMEHADPVENPPVSSEALEPAAVELNAAPPKQPRELEAIERPEPGPYFCGEADCPGHEAGLSGDGALPHCEPPDTSFTVDLTLVGDCLLATYMGQYYEGSFSWYAKNREPTYFLEQVADIFAADDFTIANLETVLTDRALTEVEKDHDPAYWFRGPTKNREILASSSVEVVSLSNNHTGDYGDEGLADTIAAVERAGLLYGSKDKTVYLEKDGFVIGLICSGLWGKWQTSSILQRLQEAEEHSDYQIVFFHGGTEGRHTPEDWMAEACRRLVDGGADLVVGSHPHVLRPVEEYHGVKIVYSLGNFCYGGSSRPENRTAIYQVRLTVDEQEVISEEHTIIPCYVYTGKSNN